MTLRRWRQPERHTAVASAGMTLRRWRQPERHTAVASAGEISESAGLACAADTASSVSEVGLDGLVGGSGELV